MLRYFGLFVVLMVSNAVLPRDPDQTATRESPSFRRESPFLFFFHLLKLKKIQQIEKVPTTPPPTDCICVPYYLCDANRTIITNGVIIIDVR